MRRRGRPCRLMRMPPPPLQSAAEEDFLTPDAIPQPVCFVSQAEQPLDPPVPYMGDVLLLQEGMSAGLFLTPTNQAHVGPTAKAARADARLTPHIHRWWLPPPEATDFCRVRCTAGTVVYLFAALGAAFVREPGAGRMAWMAMAHFTPPLSSEDAEMLDLVRVDKARRTICSCSVALEEERKDKKKVPLKIEQTAVAEWVKSEGWDTMCDHLEGEGLLQHVVDMGGVRCPGRTPSGNGENPCWQQAMSSGNPDRCNCPT